MPDYATLNAKHFVRDGRDSAVVERRGRGTLAWREAVGLDGHERR